MIQSPLSSSLCPGRRVKVLVVDDSAIMRQLLTKHLSQDPAIEVVGAAPDPYVARDKILQLNPDVLTLDIEMPRMDGITFLRKLMEYHPMPVLVVSTLTAHGTAAAVEALGAGAVDVLEKPQSPEALQRLPAALAQKIKSIARARVQAPRATSPAATGLGASLAGQRKALLMAIGASTGGVQALTELLTALPADCPPVLVVQHMPAGFTASFAQRLDSLCAVRVKEAADADPLTPGQVLIAPGGHHMLLAGPAPAYRVQIKDGPEVCHQRPSVEVMFSSIARLPAAASCVAAILTGMGNDGARGLLELRQHGAATIAQDEATCTVFGMPAEAIKCGAAQKVLPLGEIAPAMLRLAHAMAA